MRRRGIARGAAAIRSRYAPGVKHAHDPDEYRLLHAGALLSLFCVGVYMSSFGPALPFIADDMGVSLDTAGLLLTAIFTGSILASAGVAIWLHGRHPRQLTIIGVASATVGVLLIGIAPDWPLVLLGGAALGTGDGLIVAALHILMAQTSRDAAAAINRLNLYFAFGATLGPVWSAGVLEATDERWIVYAGIAALTSVTLALLIAAAAPGATEIEVPEEEFRLPGTPTAWIMGGVLFMYVGAEFGLGSWVSSYTRATAGVGVLAGGLLTAGYWGALAIGRMISGVYFSRQREPSALLAASAAGAGIASLVLALSSGNLAVAGAAAFGAGLCLGPVWPTTVAIASEGALASTTAATVTMGNSGGLLLPWLQGKILVGAGATQGVAVTAALCALMFVIVMGFRARHVATVPAT